MKIKNIKIKNPIFLAPMLGVTNLPYRLVCRKYGASIAYTEMIHIEQILHKNEKTSNALQTNNKDKPLGLQITGKTLKEFEKVIPYIDSKKYDFIDINCGCPSIRLKKAKAGSYLLKNPNKIAKAIKILKKTNLPITAKIRLGFNKNESKKIAKKIEKAGADAITLHARLSTQSSRKFPAKWNTIKKLKESIGIPLIGNGDITDGKKYKEMLDITDGAMIGRAAIGNPLIFKQCLNYTKTSKDKIITPKQRIKALIRYLKLCKKTKLIEINKIQYVGTNFLKQYPNATKHRNIFSRLKSFNEMITFINKIVLKEI